jgi:hypothetical protein
VNQDIIVEALGKHLDALQTIFNSIIILAAAIAWAGISHQTEIEALSIKFQRRHAFFVAAALYLIANTVVAILFLRIGDLFILLDRSHIIVGFSTLATHSWILNPFSYFGYSIVPRIHSAGAIGFLIFTWSVCNASLYTLDDKQHPLATKFIMGVFSFLGMISLMAIVRDLQYINIAVRIGDAAAIGDRFGFTVLERMAGVLIGIGSGALAFKIIKRGYERWSAQRG